MSLRRIDEGRAVEARDRRGQRRRCAIEVVPDGRLAHETGAVRHELPERDRPAVWVMGMELGHVRRHRRVEVDLSLLDELHDRDVGEKLRDRPDAIHGLGPGQLSRRAVDHPKAARPDDLLIVDERDRDDREALRVHLAVDQPLELIGDGAIVAPRRRRDLRRRA